MCRVSSVAAAATIALSPLAALAAAPVQIPFSTLVTEVKDHQIERLIFAPDEKSVFMRTVDGVDQTAAVLPSVQVTTEPHS